MGLLLNKIDEEVKLLTLEEAAERRNLELSELIWQEVEDLQFTKDEHFHPKNVKYPTRIQLGLGKARAVVFKPVLAAQSHTCRNYPLRRGGDWYRTERVCKTLTNRVINGQGLTITSSKRSWSSGSDHCTCTPNAYARDLSNGSWVTPQMDTAAWCLAQRLGWTSYNRGNKLELYQYITVGGEVFRVQILYRTYVGGNHFNHIHVGVKNY